MGLLVILPGSRLSPSTSRQWICLVWDSLTGTVSLSQVNQPECRSNLFRAIHSGSFTRLNWGILLGSLNHAASVVPLGRLRMCRLVMVGVRSLLVSDWDLLVPFPRRLRLLLQWWLLDGRLASKDAWTAPLASVYLFTDASDMGWGCQSSAGHRGTGLWSEVEGHLHINVKGLLVVFLALCREPSLERMSVHVFSDSSTVVHCADGQGAVLSS